MAAGIGLFGRQTAAGLGAQVLLLASLSASVRLGTVGWLTGAAYGLSIWAILTVALTRSRTRSFGAANGVTLVRATLVGGVTALVADAIDGHAPIPALVTITFVALVL